MSFEEFEGRPIPDADAALSGLPLAGRVPRAAPSLPRVRAVGAPRLLPGRAVRGRALRQLRASSSSCLTQ